MGWSLGPQDSTNGGSWVFWEVGYKRRSLGNWKNAPVLVFFPLLHHQVDQVFKHIFIHTITVPKGIKWKQAIKIEVNIHCSYKVENSPYTLKKLFNHLNNKAETRVGKHSFLQEQRSVWKHNLVITQKETTRTTQWPLLSVRWGSNSSYAHQRSGIHWCSYMRPKG